MTIVIELLGLPFVERAIIAGMILALLLGCLGVLVSVRRMAFFGEGVAHASLAGIAIAVLAGVAALPVALLWAIMIAAIIFALERSTRLPSDTLIAILFTASMAFGVILMNFSQGYQPELISFLFGNILSVRTFDLWVIGIATTLILAWFLPSLRSLVFLSLSEESASVAGIRTNLQTFIFYLALAVATVLGVKILGIVLVSAMLILPAATARLLTTSFAHYLTTTIIVSEVVILGGILLSVVFDLPTGAVIVLFGALLFFLFALTRSFQT